MNKEEKTNEFQGEPTTKMGMYCPKCGTEIIYREWALTNWCPSCHQPRGYYDDIWEEEN